MWALSRVIRKEEEANQRPHMAVGRLFSHDIPSPGIGSGRKRWDCCDATLLQAAFPEHSPAQTPTEQFPAALIILA